MSSGNCSKLTGKLSQIRENKISPLGRYDAFWTGGIWTGNVRNGGKTLIVFAMQRANTHTQTACRFVCEVKSRGIRVIRTLTSLGGMLRVAYGE